MQNFIIQGTCTYTGVHGLTSDMARNATNSQYIYTKSMAELPVDAWKEFYSLVSFAFRVSSKEYYLWSGNSLPVSNKCSIRPYTYFSMNFNGKKNMFHSNHS